MNYSNSQLNHEGEFQRAWADPNNTRFELPPVDVNQVLAEHYSMSEGLTFTRTMLWDMEVPQGMETRPLYPLGRRGAERQRLGPALSGRGARILCTLIAATPLA